MSERKSQLEKFEARQSKMKRDEEVIKEAEMKNNTLEKRAGRVAKQHNISTEDIFAIITRDSMDTFVKMWNNSMENVLKETLRIEIRKMLQEIIQEELASAYRGIVRGLTDAQSIEETIKEELDTFLNNGGFNYETRTAEEEITNYETETPVEPKSEINKKTTLDEAIMIMKNEGLDPTIGSLWVKRKGRWTTLYNKFMMSNKGERGAFKKYVESVLNKN